jgi:phosphoglycerate kinase
MANTFLAAQGYQMADSLVETEVLDQAIALLAKSEGKLMLPVDMVVADAFDAEANKQTLPLGDVPAGWRVLDIGPETVKTFGAEIAKAGTVVWNGPRAI